jgi:hypothetical protein
MPNLLDLNSKVFILVSANVDQLIGSTFDDANVSLNANRRLVEMLEI